MNLVMMVLDTLRYDVVHHRGITHVHTPNLDALRRDSVSFSAAFGEGEPTIPVRRALMTGIRSYPWRYEYDTQGVWPRIQGWHKIPPEQPTIAEILVEARLQDGADRRRVSHLQTHDELHARLGELGVRARAGERQLAGRQARLDPRRGRALRQGAVHATGTGRLDPVSA